MGASPATLLDLVRPGPELDSRSRALWKGPYLASHQGIADSGIPANPFADEGDGDDSHHWRYNSADGSVHSAVNGAAISGGRYEDL